MRKRICLFPLPTHLYRNPMTGLFSLLRHSIVITKYTGTEILICCPSPTHFCLGLGPDLPWEDDPSPGNLRFTANKILTCFFVTHSDILTSLSSARSYDLTSAYKGTLLYHAYNQRLYASAISVLCLSPVESSAQTHSTSELLRFL